MEKDILPVVVLAVQTYQDVEALLNITTSGIQVPTSISAIKKIHHENCGDQR